VPETWQRALATWDETITQDRVDDFIERKTTRLERSSGFLIKNGEDTVSASKYSKAPGWFFTEGIRSKCIRG
jgi:hypothetical protein